MKHFFDYINSNKFSLENISEAHVTVTLKIDGTALQLCFDKDKKVSFHKRSSDVTKEGPVIQRMDAFNNPAYFDAMNSLRKPLSTNNDKFNGVKILNTEILLVSNPHIISYSKKPKGGLCVLGGVTVNGGSIDHQMIDEYARILGVESVPVFFNGTLGESVANKIVEYVNRHCDPKNPHEVPSFKEDIMRILGNENLSSDLLDTENGYIEGFVFDFHIGDEHLLLKIDCPSFVLDFKKNKEKEDNETIKKETESVLERIKEYIDSNKIRFKKYSNDVFENLLMNFIKTDQGFKDCLYEEGHRCKLCERLIYSKNPNVLPLKFRRDIGKDDRVLFSLRMFTWLFGKKNNGENFPVLKDLSLMMPNNK